MRKQTIESRAEEPVVISNEPVQHVAGELIAKAVAVVGGASLVLGGVIGYALGYLERGRERENRREV